MRKELFDLVPLLITLDERPCCINLRSNPASDATFANQFHFRGLGNLDKYHISEDSLSDWMYDKEVVDKEKIKPDIFSLQREWVKREVLRINALKLQRLAHTVTILIFILTILLLIYSIIFFSFLR